MTEKRQQTEKKPEIEVFVQWHGMNLHSEECQNCPNLPGCSMVLVRLKMRHKVEDNV